MQAPPTVIMISLDGTRPSDIDVDTLPTLVRLAKKGAWAEGLISATPSNTFPSHVTLVTGVQPDRHGIVNNFFIDPQRGMFRKKNIPDWIEVEPLWSWLEARGVVTASYHWVGSEGPWRSGRGPTHWRPFSSSTPTRKKVETILDWLDLEDPDERPRFITCWFPGTDHIAHRDGPGSDTARAALAKQEAALRALTDGIRARRLWDSTTVVFVSDHGMARAETLIDFDRVLEEAEVEVRVTGLGGFAGVYIDPRKFDRVQREQIVERVVALAEREGLEAIRRGQGDSGSSFTNPRFGDLVVRAPIGTAVYRPGLPSGGFHGHVSEATEMHGLFLAAGRGVARGRDLPVLRAIDIAPTLLSLLGVEIPEWMDGKPIDLGGVAVSD
ncbi:MAG: sulfatase-like hydrolase/transferase [bacterium]|nr:sulfatase-like hydrolase/transferase [bacterium]